MSSKTLHIEDIPWSRIVHWYGRATLYPTYFNTIKNGNEQEQEEALLKIITTIEHQDGIIQVTPIALPFIFDLLYTDATNKEYLFKILLAVLRAVRHQYDYFELDDSLKKLTTNELIAEEFLWEEFKSEDDDELLWEEYLYEPQYWLETTTAILLSEEKNIQDLVTRKEEVKIVKDKTLLELKTLRLLINEL